MNSRSLRSAISSPLWASCFAFGLLFSSEARALDPAKAITQYVHDVWQTRDGLPQNSIFSIAQTFDGYIWLATVEGLVRFDGVRFTVFDRSNTREFRANYVHALIAGRDGSLWIGTYGGGLTRFDGSWTTYTTREGLLSDLIVSLFEDREHSVWIGSPENGMSKLQNGRLTSYRVGNGAPNGRVLTMCEDKEGNLWLGSYGGGLARFRNGKFTIYTRRDGLPSDTVRSIYEDREGHLWIGTDAGGLTELKSGIFATEPIGTGDSRVVALSIVEDRDGSLWVGTAEDGLRRRRQGEWEAYTKRDGLSDDSIRSLFEDREGNLWIGTQSGGVNRLANGKFTTVGKSEGLSDDRVLSVLEDQERRLWVGTWTGGLNRLEGGGITIYKKESGLKANSVSSIWKDSEGALWLGTFVGMSCLRNGRFTNYGSKEGLPTDSVQSVSGDRQGNIWIGSESGLYRFKDGHVTFFSKKDGLTSNYIVSLLEDHEGVLWVGTAERGLNRFENGRFKPYAAANRLSYDAIQVLYEDRQGNLWIGTSGGGLGRLRAGRLRVYTKKDGLFDDSIFQILEDDQGYFWIGCDHGIFRVRKTDFDDFDAGKIWSIPHVAYGREDGMRDSECNGAGQTSGWKSKDGRLWFATQGGVVVIDPEHIPLNPIPPPISIEEVLVDGKLVDRRQGVRLSPASRRLEIHYTALSFMAPSKVRFRYRLEDFDREWIDAGTRRVAYYTNLPPGAHRFRVIACNNDGVWNEKGVSLSFVLIPPFYRTIPFYAISVLVVLATAYGGHRLRVQSLKRSERELVELVKDRTESLNEAKGQLEQANTKLELANMHLEQRVAESVAALRDAEQFAAYGRLVAGVAHEVRNPIFSLQTSAYVLRKKLLAGNVEVQAELAVLGSGTARLRSLMEDLLQFAKPRALVLAATDVKSLVEAAVELARSVPTASAPTITALVNGPLPRVVMDRGRMLQVLCNLIENAGKHAQATRIEISAGVKSEADEQGGSGDRIWFRIEDNGVGIEPKHLPHLFEPFFTTGKGTGLGLAIVHRIVTEHGGTIAVESRSGSGATFLVSLPLGGPPSGIKGSPTEPASPAVPTGLLSIRG